MSRVQLERDRDEKEMMIERETKRLCLLTILSVSGDDLVLKLLLIPVIPFL